MDNQKNQIVDRLKQATNILVAVSTNPTVDQLAGAIGLTLLLNKLNKHAAAVFSGSVPSTLEFLQPDKTLEKNTDSLRDFIIALDKSKADKLRYKVEDQMVKIFITPYMTSISEKDLEFSQGDFNVDVVMTLGVNEQQDLDQAIITNGRILHDATVMSVNTHPGGSLGSINWVDEAASSLCEMLVQLGTDLKADVLDNQMATALLTGIVAETNRFSNEKTSSETMQVSAKLMAAGANQQLVATQLQQAATPPAVSQPSADSENVELPEINENKEEPDDPDEQVGPPASPEPDEPKPSDGTLEISHGEAEEDEDTSEADSQAESDPLKAIELPLGQIHIDDEGTLKPADTPVTALPPVSSAPSPVEPNQRFMAEAPTQGGTLTANSKTEALEPSTDILGAGSGPNPILSHGNSVSPPPSQTVSLPPLTPLPASDTTPESSSASPVTGGPTQTLADLEALVTTGHKAVEEQPEAGSETTVEPVNEGTDISTARDAVTQAVAADPNQPLPPVQALNAHPMDLNLGDIPAVTTSLASAFASNSSAPSLDDQPPAAPVATSTPFAPVVADNTTSASDDASSSTGTVLTPLDPTAPPPVPPPMMPPSEPTMTYGQQQLPNAEDDNKSEDPMGPI